MERVYFLTHSIKNIQKSIWYKHLYTYLKHERVESESKERKILTGYVTRKWGQNLNSLMLGIMLSELPPLPLPPPHLFVPRPSLEIENKFCCAINKCTSHHLFTINHLLSTSHDFFYCATITFLISSHYFPKTPDSYFNKRISLHHTIPSSLTCIALQSHENPLKFIKPLPIIHDLTWDHELMTTFCPEITYH